MRDNILRYVLGDRLIHIKYFKAHFQHQHPRSTLSLSDSLPQPHATLPAVPSLKKEGEAIHTKKEDEEAKAVSGKLCSAFCVATKSEQEAYDDANRSSGNVPATEDQDHIETCKGRHKDCLMCGNKQEETVLSKLQAGPLTFTTNLSVLAVCRLLYEESNNILWQTNTFSFDNSDSFVKFCSSMNLSQKHKLKKIHISMPMEIDCLCNQ